MRSHDVIGTGRSEVCKVPNHDVGVVFLSM
jgi:hypothetical protein